MSEKQDFLTRHPFIAFMLMGLACAGLGVVAHKWANMQENGLAKILFIFKMVPSALWYLLAYITGLVITFVVQCKHLKVESGEDVGAVTVMAVIWPLGCVVLLLAHSGGFYASCVKRFSRWIREENNDNEKEET